MSPAAFTETVGVAMLETGSDPNTGLTISHDALLCAVYLSDRTGGRGGGKSGERLNDLHPATLNCSDRGYCHEVRN